MSPKKVDREQKKLQIMQKAYGVLREKGYANTKMADIAAAADIGKGTVYEYFDSKEDLLAKIIEMVTNIFQEIVDGTLATLEDPEEKLRAYIRLPFDFFQEIAGLVDLFIDLISNRRREAESLEEWSNIVRFYQKNISILEGILREGIEKGVFKDVVLLPTSQVIVSMLDGIQMLYMFNKELVDVKKIGVVMEEIIFEYVT